MNLLRTDIIVPVWNRPVETRACLVSLVEHSPAARLILLNNGSDRETERLLEEFAEALDERALLISTRVNLGFVRAVNLGLTHAGAELTAIIRNTTVVTAGWLEPMLALAESRAEAGVIIPRFARHPPTPGKFSDAAVSEVASGDFAAMLIRKELFDRIGGFDEEMDGGLWCLKDYSRRALKAGYLTFAVEGGVVSCADDSPLGSAARREETAARSMAAYNGRWGTEQAFCVYYPKISDIAAILKQFEVMLNGARQGHSFTALVPPGAFRYLARAGCDRLHRNIRLAMLPRVFPDRAARREAASLRRANPGLVSVSGSEGTEFPGGAESISFVELESLIKRDETALYGVMPLALTRTG